MKRLSKTEQNGVTNDGTKDTNDVTKDTTDASLLGLFARAAQQL